MIRVNLLPPPADAIGLSGVAFSARSVRELVLGCAVAVCAALLTFGIQTEIRERASRAAVEAELAVSARSSERAATNRLAATVARLQRLEREALQRRLSGNDVAVALAHIGNAVPPQVWLDSVERSAGGYVLSGGAFGLEAIGETIRSFSRHALPYRASILSLSRDERTETVHFSLRLTRAAEPKGSAAPVSTP